MMPQSLGEQLEVLRDEALNSAELSGDAGGEEVFDAIVSRVVRMNETDPGLDMALRDALNRRLAWGESLSLVIADCDSVCRRLLVAVQRSLPDPEDASRIAAIIAEVSCDAARHLARNAVERASKERALQRREMMVQRQLETALNQQDKFIKNYSK